MSGLWTGTRAVDPKVWDVELMHAIERHFVDVGWVTVTSRSPRGGADHVVGVEAVIGFAEFPYATTRLPLLLAHVSEMVAPTRHMVFPAFDILRIERQT